MKLKKTTTQQSILLMIIGLVVQLITDTKTTTDEVINWCCRKWGLVPVTKSVDWLSNS
jgi:hypothetical protein